MVIKRFVLVFAVLAVLVGLSQLLFASWWVDTIPGIIYSRWLAGNGIVGVLFGAVLLIALAEKQILLRGFVAFLGVFALATGVLALVNPEMTRDLVEAVFLNRTESYQTMVVWAGGVLRLVIGVVLIYAVLRSPGGPESAVVADEVPPTE